MGRRRIVLRRKPLSFGDWLFVAALGATEAITDELGRQMDAEVKKQNRGDSKMKNLQDAEKITFHNNVAKAEKNIVDAEYRMID